MLSSTLEIYSNSKLIREVSPNPTPNHVHSPITDFNHLSDRSFLLCLSLNCSSRTRSSTISFSKLVPRKSRSRSVSISQLVSSSTSFLISLSLFWPPTATCTSHLCPHTLSCVPSPSHCPCPMPQQIRCSYPDTSDPKSKDPMGLGGSFCVQEGSCDRINDMRHWATERDFKLSEFKGLI